MSKIIKGGGEGVLDPTLFDVSGSIVSRELLLLSEKGREMIERAKQEVARIRQEAQKVLEQALEEREGERRRGYEQGYQEGLAQVTERLVAIEAEREKVISGYEKEILEMVLEIAKKVVDRELKRSGVVPLIRQALDRAVGQRVTIRVHPADRSRLGSEAELAKVLEESRTWTLVEDEKVGAGGCVVETELGTVDARLETQWAAIRKSLGIEGSFDGSL